MDHPSRGVLALEPFRGSRGLGTALSPQIVICMQPIKRESPPVPFVF